MEFNLLQKKILCEQFQEKMMTAVRILLINDQPVFWKGIKMLIEKNSRYQVVSEADTTWLGIQMAREYRPDMILLDLSLPDHKIIKLIRNIRHLFPKIRMVVVSINPKAPFIAKVFNSGASGYLAKQSVTEILMNGIDHVLG